MTDPMASRKKPGVTFWATVALVVVLVGYPLSIGPAIWLDLHSCFPATIRPLVRAFYEPVLWLSESPEAPARVHGAAVWYMKLWGF